MKQSGKQLNSCLADCKVRLTVKMIPRVCTGLYCLMCSVFHTLTQETVGQICFHFPFCIFLQASAHAPYSTALLFPVPPGSNHCVTLESANHQYRWGGSPSRLFLLSLHSRMIDESLSCIEWGSSLSNLHCC